MKRQKVYLLVACLLAVLAVVTIVYKRGGFNKSLNANKLSTIFAIKDTSLVTRIFMADMYGNKVLLTKEANGWMVDRQRPASDYQISDLLVTMATIRVGQPVAKPAQESVIQMLAVNSTKVEVHEKAPLFTLFGRSFFTKERHTKTFFLGDATQNNMGSYALLEGMSEPYIVYQPGFRGYISPRFIPKPVEWYSHRVFNTKLTRIKNASFIDYDHPENSFYVEKSGPRSFTLYDHNRNMVPGYDTLLLVNMLSEFRERNYEMFLHDMSPAYKDTVLMNHYKTISITDVDDRITTMDIYHLIDEGELYIEGDLVDEMYYEFNKERAYATINNNNEEIYTIQYFQFDRQIQPVYYFLER